ncbi:MAG: multicopper oxidase domain-containing protein, partial [Herminiimonas sp.]|nr:multicopper oxidase domain-containing protein [Herminiimonas sp.]
MSSHFNLLRPAAAGVLPVSPSRRRFVTGCAAAGALAGLNLWPSLATAASPPAGRNVLSGSTFDLDIGATPVNITGKDSIATAVNGMVPAPLLRWREGSTVTMRVTNRLPVTTSI